MYFNYVGYNQYLYENTKSQISCLFETANELYEEII